MNDKENVYEVIGSDERFRVLQEILEATGIGEAMTKEREAFTFFAPIDDAFEKLSKPARRLLTSPEGRGLVAAILGQHLIPKSYLYANDLRKKKSFENLNGARLKIKEEKNMLLLGKVHILMPGVAATNGVVFPVDGILPVQKRTFAGKAV